MLNKKKTERHLTCKYETLRGILIFTYHYITGWFHKGKDLQTDLKWNLNCMLGVAAWDTIRALRPAIKCLKVQKRWGDTTKTETCGV